MFEMLTSCAPFFARSMLQTHRNVLCQSRLEFPLHISSQARHICRRFLERNIEGRLGCSSSGLDAKEVKQHGWFEQQIDWTTMIEQARPAPYPIQPRSTSDESQGETNCLPNIL
jgi:hypothetical protein